MASLLEAKDASLAGAGPSVGVAEASPKQAATPSPSGPATPPSTTGAATTPQAKAASKGSARGRSWVGGQVKLQRHCNMSLGGILSSRWKLFLVVVSIVLANLFGTVYLLLQSATSTSASSLAQSEGKDLPLINNNKLDEKDNDELEGGALWKNDDDFDDDAGFNVREENKPQQPQQNQNQRQQQQQQLQTPKDQVKPALKIQNEETPRDVKQDQQENPKKPSENSKQKKPLNILFLYADDWRYDTLAAAGNPILQTPHLDALAAQGVHFTHACVTTSICMISRATLTTGQYYSRHQTMKIMPPIAFYDKWNETLYGLLKHPGEYYSGFVGKWHHLNFPFKKFDFARDYYGKHWMWDGNKERKIHVTAKNERDAMEFLQKRPGAQANVGLPPTAKRQPYQPFALTVAFYATHAQDNSKEQFFPQNASMAMYQNVTIPLAPSATHSDYLNMPSFFHNHKNEGRTRWKWRFDNPDKHQRMMKNYYRMATEVDAACGRLIHELKRQGVWEETLVIFTTDNGYFHAEHGLADKWYAHQESIRVPLIIYDPRMDSEKVGTKNDDFVLNIDLAPTMLKAAGIEVPTGMQGRDIADLYVTGNDAHEEDGDGNADNEKEDNSNNAQAMGNKEEPPPPPPPQVQRRHLQVQNIPQNTSQLPWRQEFFYEYPQFPNHGPNIPACEALVRKDMKYMYWPTFDYEQLFDLVKDPYERLDCIQEEDYKEVLEEMRLRFKELKEQAL